MNIAIYVHRFLPAVGGIINYVLYLISELVKHGVNVEIHTGDVIFFGKRRVVLEHSRTKISGKVKLVIERDLLPIAPFYLRAFEKSDSDILNIHGHAELFTLKLLPTLRRLKKPIILTSHGALQTTALGMYYVESAPHVGTMLVKKTLSRGITLRLVKRYVDIIIASSDKEKNILLSHDFDAKRLIVIKNFVPDWYFAYKADNERALKILKQHAIEPYNYIITVSRIDYNKGLHHVVKALAYLYKVESKRIKYLIVGPDEGALNFVLSLSKKLGIRNNIIYLGKITDKKVLLTLNRYSLAFVYPLYIGAAHSLAVIEAMSQSTPILISDTLNSLCKHIEHYVHGLIFEYGNITSLASSIATLSENASLRKKLGKNAFSYAYEHHRLSRAVEKYMKIDRTRYEIYYR